MKEYLTPMGPTPLHVNPIFEIGPMEPRFSEWLVFEGISVDESGRQHYLDASVAYKRAVLNAIDYLSKFGYSKEQVPILHIFNTKHLQMFNLTVRIKDPCFCLRTSVNCHQMYLLLSCCPCEGRISGIVDAPNAVATLAIPTAIFDQVYKLTFTTAKRFPILQELIFITDSQMTFFSCRIFVQRVRYQLGQG